MQNHKSVMVLRYTRKTIQGVVAYFFTAKHNDREAVGFFINHLELFKSITNIVDTHLLEVNYWTKDFIVVETKTLLDDTERRLIFDDIKKLMSVNWVG